MEHQTTKIADELNYHTKTILQEANRGNTAARRWLKSAFPGHTCLFDRLWSGDRIDGLIRGKARRVKAGCERK